MPAHLLNHEPDDRRNDEQSQNDQPGPQRHRADTSSERGMAKRLPRISRLCRRSGGPSEYATYNRPSAPCKEPHAYGMKYRPRDYQDGAYRNPDNESEPTWHVILLSKSTISVSLIRGVSTYCIRRARVAPTYRGGQADAAVTSGEAPLEFSRMTD